jgi:hypothetical protein
MTLLTILTLLFAHFFSDWYLQDREDAVKKSTDPWTLQSHVLLVSLVIAIAFGTIDAGWLTIPFAIIYGIAHYYQDKNIYKGIVIPEGVSVSMYKPLWDRIALDQFLHLALLFFLASLL